MSADRPNPKIKTSAFGVEPGYAPFRLRQARYQALAESVAGYARRHGDLSKPLRLLDVGVGSGRSLRYIEAQPGAEHIEYHGVDLFPNGDDGVFQRDKWTMYRADLEEGLPFLDSDAFDIVLCEQVLEHVQNVDGMLAELERVLRPSGLMVLGVPTFPPGFHLIPRYISPLIERMTTPAEKRREARRGHVQAFSLATFLGAIGRHTGLEVQQSRGFRIISGGPLRALEHHRWWYRFNRAVGELVPSLSIETQVVLTKPQPAKEVERRVVPLRRAERSRAA